MENLYNLVNKTMSNDTKLSKVQFGYTVDTYNGVLEALYNARARLVRNGGGGGAGAAGELSGQPNAITKRWTELQSIEVGGVVSGDGFVVGEGSDYEKYRQQQVRILSYMPFVVERPKDGKKVSFYAPFEIGNAHLDTRGQAASGKHTLPVKNMDPEKCKNIGRNLGSINNSFEIGIGVDLEEGGTADTFFEKCYNKIYSKGCASKLAEVHALCAEVAFPHGGNADAVNIKVTVNSGVSEKGVAHTIYFPIPLLLTNTFNTLGKVNVNFGDKTITVGQEDTSYPFAGSKFNHLDSTLEGYTPQYVKDIVSDASRYLTTKDNVTIGYNSKTYSLGSGEGCYVRFYIDKEKEAEAVKILGKDIPDEYKNEIFKGIREAKMGEEVIGYEASGGGYGAIEDIKGGENDTCLYVNDVDWEKLKTIPRFKNYYQYKDVIIRECNAENLNVRLTLAHFQAESAAEGGALSSNAWRKYNNPSGMLGKLKTVHGVPCVTTSADNVGGDKTSHGKFLKFETPEIGIKAHCRWVNRSSFYGVRTKNLRTVNQYAVAMQYGVPAGGQSKSFCGGPNYRCPNYAKNIITHYKDIPHFTKEQMQAGVQR